MNDYEKIKQELADAKKKIRIMEGRLTAAEEKTRVVAMAQAFLHETKTALSSIYAPIHFSNQYFLPELKNIYQTIEHHLSEIPRKKFLKNCELIDKYLKQILNGAEKIRVMAEFSFGTLDSEEDARNEVYLDFVLDAAKDESRLSGSGCPFIVDMPQDFVVWGNSILLERVFVNLINNAVEAMAQENEKEIRLKCAYQEVDSKQVAYFEFSDNGPGISLDLQDRIFLQGFSTKESGVDKTSRGHGLYMCKEIIEGFHHGEIKVESEPEKGTTFIFWIPLSAQKTIDSNNNRKTKPTILMIEDDEDIRDILKEKLEELGLEVSCARNVEEGMKRIQEREWRIALVNMRLPSEIYGIDMIKAIRLRWPSTIIVAMSGDRDKDLKQEALAAGAIDYLAKPDDLKMEVFDDKIRSLLQKDAA